MNYDSFCMAAAVEELRAGYLDAFVDQAYQPEPLGVLLAFTGRGPRRFWLLSSDARWPRSHAERTRRPNPDTPPNFCMLLRKHLNGSRLVDVEQVRFDRILRLTFRRGEERRVLVHEVMGRHSNLVLLDEGGLILGAVKNVPPSQTRVRPVLPGMPYAEPPGARPDPRALDRKQLASLLEGAQTPEEITRTLSGWGTFAAREAVSRCASMSNVRVPAERVDQMSNEGAPTPEAPSPTPNAQRPTPNGLAGVVWEMMERVRRGAFEPGVFEDEEGRPKGVWAFRSVQEGWTRSHGAPSVSAACEEYYGFLETHSEAEARRKTVLASLERALKTARLQLAEAEGHLEGLDRAEGLRIAGELLSAHAGQVERGAREAVLPNWYDPEGGTLRVELDPELDARENAQRYFHRYRRAMAAAEAALDRVPALTRRVDELERLDAETRAAAPERLDGLLETVRGQGLLREQSAREPGERPEAEFPPGVRIKRIHAGEWEILYGENATSNDFLTTRVAKPGDLWLHARAVTGSHVVVRGVISLDRLPPEVLRQAAHAAAAHSEAKHSSVVPVDYTFRRYVRKPRGSPPGSVTYTGEKTVHVDPAEGLRR